MSNYFWPALTTLGMVLLQFLVTFNVGRQRQACKIGPPHTIGHPMLERAFRVQMNTLEWGAMILPLVWICALFFSPQWAAAGGGLWIVARAFYAKAYMKDPLTRLPAFFSNLGILALLFLASLWGVLRGAIG